MLKLWIKNEAYFRSFKLRLMNKVCYWLFEVWMRFVIGCVDFDERMRLVCFRFYKLHLRMVLVKCCTNPVYGIWVFRSKKKNKLKRFMVKKKNTKGYLALSYDYNYWISIQFTSCCLLFSVSNELKMPTFL